VESRAKIMGHPIHPILIPFPLGLLSTSVVFDVVHLLTGDEKWAEISFWMIAAGVIGGLAAAVFGLIDSLGGFLGGGLVVRLGVRVAEGAHLDAPGSLSGPSVGRGSTGARRGG
jgi:hypothetical protein